MKPVRAVITLSVIAAAAGGCTVFWSARYSIPDLTGVIKVAAAPRISPDYTSIVIPPNCAPLNFIIDEPGAAFIADLYGISGKHLTLKTSRPSVRIPLRRWRALLSANKGKTIAVDIYARAGTGAWTRFSSIVNTVTVDEIDRYLVYRLMPPLYTTYGKMGIYQRDLSTFDEKPLWLNRMSDNNCMNCHTFKRNDPDFFVAHMRGGPGSGTLIKQGKNVFKVNTATGFNRPAGYPAWHPSGDIIAFSVNTIRQFFHATGSNREGFDMGSKIILYHIPGNTVSASPRLSDTGEMPTQPEWSPDGSYLYYCTAPQIPGDSISHYHTTIFYDLLCIRYDAVKDTWGNPEMILSHEKTGQSISFPRISPDGKQILFCMAAHGTFPVFRPGGDLYLLDVQSRQYRRLDVNSGEPESFPRWSSNGKWFVFTSKRIDGTCARPYFSHIDADGNASKPYILPQRDPDFYTSLLRTYNLPELISRPFAVSPQKLVRAFYDNTHMRHSQLSPAIKAQLSLWKKAVSADRSSTDTWKVQRTKATTH